jgi:DNA mismatch repair ATPase MutS
MAIAQSVIDYILSEVQAFTLFSTHYTQITDQYLNSNQVELMKMSYEFEGEELKFGYQLVKGVA